MTLEPIACNNCGAALEVAAGTNYVACTHCGGRLAVRRTATSRFTELLEKLDAKTDAMAGHLAELARRAELELIDREWQIERERYLSNAKRKSGFGSEPNGAAALVGGLLAAAFGGFWVWMALSIGAPRPLVAFGVVFIGIALVSRVYGWARAGQYWSAKRVYEARRAAAEGGDADPGDHDPSS